MATRSRIPAWRTPRTEEPGSLQSIGSQRVGNDWSDLTQQLVLEIIILGKISHTEEDKYMISFPYGILKKYTTGFIYKTSTNSHRKQTYGYQWGKGRGRYKLRVWD